MVSVISNVVGHCTRVVSDLRRNHPSVLGGNLGHVCDSVVSLTRTFKRTDAHHEREKHSWNQLTYGPTARDTGFAIRATRHGGSACRRSAVGHRAYYDLNLDTPEDVAGLYGRIRAAAIDVCKQSEGSLRTNRVYWECVAHAIANAVKDVHNEKLSAYHWERIRDWKRR